jgi:hypothetical protein
MNVKISPYLEMPLRSYQQAQAERERRPASSLADAYKLVQEPPKPTGEAREEPSLSPNAVAKTSETAAAPASGSSGTKLNIIV